MRRAVPNSTMDSVMERKILNPLLVLSSISFLQKDIDSGYRVEEWVLSPMVCWVVSRDHSRTISTGKPLAV